MFKILSKAILVGAVVASVIPTPANAGLVPVSQVAYIYSSNTTDSQSFERLLGTRGYAVTKIQMDAVAGYDFAGTDVVIVGDDTGGFSEALDSWTWGSDAALETITVSQVPVVGIGLGGSLFFQQAGVTRLAFSNSWLDYGTGVELGVEYQNLGASSGGALALYTGSTMFSANYIPQPDGAIELIAKQPGNDTHYVITRTANDPAYTAWGFRASPATMTPAGRQFFVTLVGEAAARGAAARGTATDVSLETVAQETGGTTQPPSIGSVEETSGTDAPMTQDLTAVESSEQTQVSTGQISIPAITWPNASGYLGATRRWLL